MNNMIYTFTSMDATSLKEFVGKTVTVRTKQQHSSKGVVHTIDPVTRSVVLKTNGQCEVFTGINIESILINDALMAAES